jgi:hypothetical protein
MGRYERFYSEELPLWVEQCYEEFSARYTYKYRPLSSIDTRNGKVDLFTYIEEYFKKNYKIPYSINRHFEFHTTAIFYAPTENFGLSLSPEYKNECLNILDYSKRDKRFIHDSVSHDSVGIFHKISGTDGVASTIVKKKISSDIELEFQFIKLRLRSALKRFFIQGQVSWQWITIDQIKYFGIDKFSNCLNHEFKQIEYGLYFHETNGHLGSPYYKMDDGRFEPLTFEDEEIVTTLEKNYYAKLKLKRISDYTYRDVLEKVIMIKKHNAVTSKFRTKGSNYIIIDAKCKALEGIPLVSLNDNKEWISKQGDVPRYKNYLKYVSGHHNGDAMPYDFPVTFNLSISDVFNDENLVQEYLETFNEPENEIRKRIGLPRVGEGWISETNLFYEIKTKFSEEVVIHHGRPSWLGRQHLDIYFPKFNIGIEYQGDQHFQPIEFFGGEKAYKKNKERDKRKKLLCQQNKCHLIYVKPGYSIDDVFRQIGNTINS